MDAHTVASGSVAAAIGWFYLVTNSARVFTYIPQIACVWRCRDGARSLSLITWCSWVVSHAAAMAYGAVVVHDVFFFAISTINFTCCATVASIAARRRGQFGRRDVLPRASMRELAGKEPASPPEDRTLVRQRS